MYLTFQCPLVDEERENVGFAKDPAAVKMAVAVQTTAT